MREAEKGAQQRLVTVVRLLDVVGTIIGARANHRDISVYSSPGMTLVQCTLQSYGASGMLMFLETEIVHWGKNIE